MTDGPGVSLLSEDDGIALIRQRLRSRKWWMLLGIDNHSTGWMSAIESRFYSGKKGRDFDLVMVIAPGRAVIGVALAKKTRMSPSQLSAFIAKESGQPPMNDELLTEKDCLCITADQSERAVAMVTWLHNRVGPLT